VEDRSKQDGNGYRGNRVVANVCLLTLGHLAVILRTRLSLATWYFFWNNGNTDVFSKAICTYTFGMVNLIWRLTKTGVTSLLDTFQPQ